MFLWDEMQADGDQLPALVRGVVKAEHIPERLRLIMSELDRHPGVSSVWLRQVYALACGRFARDLQDPDWAGEAVRRWGAVPEGTAKSNPVVAAVIQVAQGRELAPQARSELARLLPRYPMTWWKAELARETGLNWPGWETQVERARLAVLRDEVTALLLQYVTPVVVLMLFGWGLRGLQSRVAAALAPSSRRLFRLWPAPGVLSAFFAVHLAVSLAGWGIAWVWIKIQRTHDSLVLCEVMVTVASTLLTVLGMKWFFTRRPGTLRRTMGFAARDLWADRNWMLGFSMAAALGLLEQVVGLAIARGRGGLEPDMVDWLSRSHTWMGGAALPYGLVVGCLLAPFWEEVVLRGFLFGSLRTIWRPEMAALLSSGVFALGHWYGWMGTSFVFAFGLLSCWLYQRSRNLASCMFMHGLTNLLVFLSRHLMLSY